MAESGGTILDKLNSGLFWCRSCGEAHRGMFDLACIAPDAWPGPRDYEPIGDLTFQRNFLSADFAFLEGGSFFLRCTLDIAVEGVERPFGFGAWAMVQYADFRAYWDDFDNPDPAPAEPWPGLLANGLKPFPDAVNLDCLVRIQPNLKRPKIDLLDESHPLALAQRDGITAARLLSIYRANGHDFG